MGIARAFAQGSPGHGEVAGRLERQNLHVTTPGDDPTALGGDTDLLPPGLIWQRAQMADLDVGWSNIRMEDFALDVIGNAHHDAIQGQVSYHDAGQLVGRALGGIDLCTGRKGLEQATDAVIADRKPFDMQVGADQMDHTERPGPVEQTADLEIHQEVVVGQQNRVVGIQHFQTGHPQCQCVWIDLDLAEAERPAQLTDFSGCNPLDQPRQQKKAHQGICNHQHYQPEAFAPWTQPRCEPVGMGCRLGCRCVHGSTWPRLVGNMIAQNFSLGRSTRAQHFLEFSLRRKLLSDESPYELIFIRELSFSSQVLIHESRITWHLMRLT
jgi:hypothetical protein